jgi:pSer/pThr/pTyr-binding forkhead associated (FHA) protein
MPRLIMRRGPTPGAIFELENDKIAIGRGSKNDIVIRDNEVSREHCRLRRVVDEFELEDLSSSNGTFVNGQRVTGTWLLQHGSIVELGDTVTMEYMRSVSRKPTGAITEDRPADAVPEVVYQHLLMVTMGPEMGRIFRLSSAIVTVGRDLSNDIVIQDPELSRFHMRLRRGANAYAVEDMGSTNGTFINGTQVTQPRELQADDVIRLARQIRLQYVIRTENVKGAGDETLIVGGHNGRMFVDQALNRLGAQQTTPLTTPLSSGTSYPPRAVSANDEGPKTLLRQTGRLRPNAMTGQLADSVFIAYARPDWDGVVASLVTSLQQAGIQPWVDQYLVQHDDEWRAALEQALKECWAMVVVVSPLSLASNYVRMAYKHFGGLDKPLIAFVTDADASLPADLAQVRSISYDRDNPQRSLHKLILEIMHLRR